MTFTVYSPIGNFLAVLKDHQLYSFSKVSSYKNIKVSCFRDRTSLNLKKLIQKQIQQYQSGQLTHFTIPLATHGTSFQQKVWQVITQIPYNSVKSYQWVAEQIGHAQAVRAVGQACSKNPFPIIVPCHRVSAKTHLGGYAYGIEAKKQLLQLEKTYAKKNLCQIE